MKKPPQKPDVRPKLAESNPLLAPRPRPPARGVAADALKKPRAR